MKGDFSRQTFEPRNHYSAVLMQQGRVQVDADWNEQDAILRRRLRVETRDVVGPCGGPRYGAGFLMSLDGVNLTIGAGRYYVDGLLVENDEDVAYEEQPDRPDHTGWEEDLKAADAHFGLVYLDVWERHLTALDDERIREVALGGPDTATRLKTVWQVRVLPVTDANVVERQKLREAIDKLKARLEVVQAGDLPDPEEIAKLTARLDELSGRLDGLGSADVTCDSSFAEWDALTAEREPELNARSMPPPPVDGPCIVPPTVGYRRLENQLYRVEIHGPGAVGTATFVWSRDNGTVVTSIEKIAGKDVTVHDLGPDAFLGFAPGQWVEIADDASELAGLPGWLGQIDSIDPHARRVTLNDAPPSLAAGPDGVDATLHPKLRRWDQVGDDQSNGVPTGADWFSLEDGVEVQFAGGEYRTGDYWLIPARTATADVEWPPLVAGAAPQAQPRDGVRHVYCRLALIMIGDGQIDIADCRTLFDPLTDPCCGPTSDAALHVLKTNWQNDDIFPSTRILEEGLRVTLDAPPDPRSLSMASFQVEFELPLADKSVGQAWHRITLPATVGPASNDGNVVVWKPGIAMTSQVKGAPKGVKAAPQAITEPDLVPLKVSSEVLARTFPVHAVAAVHNAGEVASLATFRAWVTLKGPWIWGEADRHMYLDGEATGLPGVRADGSPRTALDLPSSGGPAPSDFQSWFTLVVAASSQSFRVTTIRFLDVDNQPPPTGDITMPIPNEVVLAEKQQFRSIDVFFNDDVQPESLQVKPHANVFLDQIDIDVPKRVVGKVTREAANQIRFTATDPKTFLHGRYQLVAVGKEQNGINPIQSLAGLPLSDADGHPGGDFVMQFDVM